MDPDTRSALDQVLDILSGLSKQVNSLDAKMGQVYDSEFVEMRRDIAKGKTDHALIEADVTLIKRIVFGLVGIVLTSVIVALLQVVMRKP